MKKKIIIVGLICVSLLPFGNNVVKADYDNIPIEEDMDEITPRYKYTRPIVLSYSSGIASCTLSATKTTYKISVTLYLEKWNGSRWVVQSSNSKSGTGRCKVTLPVKKSSGKYQIRVSGTSNGERFSDSKDI